MTSITRHPEFGYLVMMKYLYVNSIIYMKNGKPLEPEEVLQDISQDHANKTVTIATHPHLGIPQAYIHPCKHASVMKKMVTRMEEAGKVPRSDQ
jgi:ubiquitin-like-conjugating enzyme ATG3